MTDTEIDQKIAALTLPGAQARLRKRAEERALENDKNASGGAGNVALHVRRPCGPPLSGTVARDAEEYPQMTVGPASCRSLGIIRR